MKAFNAEIISENIKNHSEKSELNIEVFVKVLEVSKRSLVEMIEIKMQWVQYAIEIGKLTVAVAATYGLFTGSKLLQRKMNEIGVNSTLDTIRL